MRVRVIDAGGGVHLVVGPRTNWCLIRAGDAVTLIDAAWPKDYALVVDSLDRIGSAPAQVEAVVLTHAHPDHIGVAERFRSDHGSTIHAHARERGHALGEYEQHVRTIDLILRMWRPSVFAFASTPILHGALNVTPAAAVEVFESDPIDAPGGPVPVFTPGHTSGHCSFLLPAHGVVVTGDALVNQNLLTGRPGPRLMPRIFSHDWEQAASSLDNLAGLDADVLLPGHGMPLHVSPAEAVRRARRVLGEGGWWDR